MNGRMSCVIWSPSGALRGGLAIRGRLAAWRKDPSDQLASPGRIDVIGGLAGRHVLHRALGVLPQPVLLVAVRELDAESAREDGQVMLDGDGPLRLEAAEEPL